MKTKISLIIVGMNRSSQYTSASISQNLIKPLTNSHAFTTNVSFTLIDTEGEISNPRSSERGPIEVELAPPLNTYPCEYIPQSALWKRVSTMHNKLFSLGDEYKDDGKSLANYLIFLAALAEAEQNVNDQTEVVIFARPDIAPGRICLLRTRVVLIAILNRLGMKAILVPNWGNYRGVNDRFAIMTGSVKKSYLGRLRFIPAWENTGLVFHSERFLGWVLSDVAVFRSIFSKMWRVRIGGVFETNDVRNFRAPIVAKIIRKRRLWW